MSLRRETTNNSTNNEYWRITIGNINSFPTGSNGQNVHKLDIFRQLVVDNSSDIILLSEHNKNLNNLRQDEQPQHLMKQWWPKTITRATFLASNNKSTFEPGGTMIITNSRASAYTCYSGQDKHLLGRWNYITLRGKNEHYTTIISVYRPSKQQETYMRQIALSANRR